LKPKKPSPNQAKPKKLENNRTEPKPVGLNRFWFGFGFLKIKKKFNLVIFFIYKNQTEPKIITSPVKHSKPSKTKQARLLPDNLRMVSSLSQ